MWCVKPVNEGPQTHSCKYTCWKAASQLSLCTGCKGRLALLPDSFQCQGQWVLSLRSFRGLGWGAVLAPPAALSGAPLRTGISAVAQGSPLRLSPSGPLLEAWRLQGMQVTSGPLLPTPMKAVPISPWLTEFPWLSGP